MYGIFERKCPANNLSARLLNYSGSMNFFRLRCKPTLQIGETKSVSFEKHALKRQLNWKHEVAVSQTEYNIYQTDIARLSS